MSENIFANGNETSELEVDRVLREEQQAKPTAVTLTNQLLAQQQETERKALDAAKQDVKAAKDQDSNELDTNTEGEPGTDEHGLGDPVSDGLSDDKLSEPVPTEEGEKTSEAIDTGVTEPTEPTEEEPKVSEPVENPTFEDPSEDAMEDTDDTTTEPESDPLSEGETGSDDSQSEKPEGEDSTDGQSDSGSSDEPKEETNPQGGNGEEGTEGNTEVNSEDPLATGEEGSEQPQTEETPIEQPDGNQPQVTLIVDDQPEEDEEAFLVNESFNFKTQKVSKLKPNWDFFKGLRKSEHNRLNIIREMGLESFLESTEVGTANKENESQPGATVEASIPNDGTQQNIQNPPSDKTAVVNVKEGVIEALTFLGEVNRKYILNTDSFIAKLGESILLLDQRTGNMKALLEKGDLIFEQKLISDTHMLKNISFDNTSEPRSTLKRMKQYLKDSNDVAKMITDTPFDQMKDVFASRNFVDKGEVVDYSKVLPGFSYAKVSVPEYVNYVKTNITDYKYYTIKEDNPNNLYNLKPIAVGDATDTKHYLTIIQELLVGLAVSIDILKGVSINFSKYMDELKILRVNVQDDEIQNLGEIDLDAKVKDFIILKMVVEMSSVNTNLTIDYVNSLFSMLETCVKLNDKAAEFRENNMPKAEESDFEGGSDATYGDEGGSEDGDDFGGGFDDFDLEPDDNGSEENKDDEEKKDGEEDNFDDFDLKF